MKNLADRIGLCQWFHYEDHETVEQTVAILQELELHHLRTGISWADFHRPNGRAWYDWVFRQLHQAEIDPLVSIWHTPPSIAEGGHCSGPPLRLDDYGDFVAYAIDLYGHAFHDVELWNEPNNRIKWNFIDYDPHWKKFAAMIATAARYTKEKGKRTVLGGMIPVDHHWLRLINSHGGLRDIDVVAIHAFPGMWWNHAYCWDWPTHWKGWQQKLSYIEQHAGERPIWVTETGLATWNDDRKITGRHDEQGTRLEDALASPAGRVYWYSAIDLPPHRACIEMTEDHGRIDHNEYHMGLVTAEGVRKPAYAKLRDILQNRATPKRASATSARA